ncbi:hypothetical protein POM88_028898 [Heracleum sosnowskyi]|uniref:F-box domain-containing protein n=1 Tax=Heracleum sosnowskyi TaxID=360622 RepID=A0AAD8MEE5_9APIA|nr:hypothetical protein POM88_028898 [Heracleum sosnowskyi]
MESPISKAEVDEEEKDDQDRISKLPDTLLHHILTTYLDSTARKRTWALSKRWVNFWTTCKLDAALRSDYSLRLCRKDFVAFPCVVSTCLKELVLTDCVNVHLMNWTLPSLTYLYLKNVKFGNQISGFDKLETLTVAGFIHNTFTINCRNLKFLNLGPDFSSCTLVVSTPNLSIFKLCSADHVPSFSPGVVFPCIMEAHFDIMIKDPDWASYDSVMIDLTMQNFIALLNAVNGTQWLWLSRQTIQVLRRIPDFSAYQLSPFCNLEFLYLLGIHEKPTRSTDHVIDYLLSTSPSAKILHDKAAIKAMLVNDYPRVAILTQDAASSTASVALFKSWLIERLSYGLCADYNEVQNLDIIWFKVSLTSSGNGCPGLGRIMNTSPGILLVAASMGARKLITNMQLDNGWDSKLMFPYGIMMLMTVYR